MRSRTPRRFARQWSGPTYREGAGRARHGKRLIPQARVKLAIIRAFRITLLGRDVSHFLFESFFDRLSVDKEPVEEG